VSLTLTDVAPVPEVKLAGENVTAGAFVIELVLPVAYTASGSPLAELEAETVNGVPAVCAVDIAEPVTVSVVVVAVSYIGIELKTVFAPVVSDTETARLNWSVPVVDVTVVSGVNMITTEMLAPPGSTAFVPGLLGFWYCREYGPEPKTVASHPVTPP
jgi:hypothetical protein